MPTVLLARLDELPDGGMIQRRHGLRDVLLARVRGEVFALDDQCTHAGGSLHEGVLSCGDDGSGDCRVTCPWHEASFELRTGKVHQDTPWATDTRAYRVELRGDEIWVDL